MFACRNLYYEFVDIFITDQNQYLRVMARELSDIRAEQRDLRRLIIAKKSEGSRTFRPVTFRLAIFRPVA